MAFRRNNSVPSTRDVLYSAASLLPVRTILCDRENLVLLLGRPDLPRNRLAHLANKRASGSYGCNGMPCMLSGALLLLDAFLERNPLRTLARLGLRVYVKVNPILEAAPQPRGWRVLGTVGTYPSPNHSGLSDYVDLPGGIAKPFTHKEYEAFRPPTSLGGPGYHPLGSKECNRDRETGTVHDRRRLHFLGSP